MASKPRRIAPEELRHAVATFTYAVEHIDRSLALIASAAGNVSDAVEAEAVECAIESARHHLGLLVADLRRAS